MEDKVNITDNDRLLTETDILDNGVQRAHTAMI